MRDSSYMNPDLIQRLRDSADGLKSCDECNGECRGTCIFTEAADAIEELVAAVPEWHPVSEPPKQNGKYWCNIRCFHKRNEFYQDKLYFDGDCWTPADDDIAIERVTHWMPLPDPPKEVE